MLGKNNKKTIMNVIFKSNLFIPCIKLREKKARLDTTIEKNI